MIKNTTQPLPNHHRLDENVTEEELLPSLQALAKSMIEDLPDVQKLYEQIQEDFIRSKEMAAERVDMVDKVRDMIEKHLKRLTQELEKLEELDPNLASTPAAAMPTPVASTPSTADLARLKAPYTKSAVVDTPLPASHSILSSLERKLSTNPKPFPIKKATKKKTSDSSTADTQDQDETLYCICQQVSYGEMIACDNKVDCSDVGMSL
jgi:hypothetical protein